MKSPIRALVWDRDEGNIRHLWHSHRVTPDEVEEIVYGCEGEDPRYIVRRDGDCLVIYGSTCDGRLLCMAAQQVPDGGHRVFAARDMNNREKQAYRKRLK